MAVNASQFLSSEEDICSKRDLVLQKEADNSMVKTCEQRGRKYKQNAERGILRKEVLENSTLSGHLKKTLR